MAVVATNRPRTAPCDHPKRLWYAPDLRIRTEAAAHLAKEITTRILAGENAVQEYGPHALFRALHTCAFRAARPARGKQISEVRRRRWAGRWKTIRDHIVEKNMPLVRWLVMRQRSTDRGADALFSDGSLALVYAVERFNPWLGYRTRPGPTRGEPGQRAAPEADDDKLADSPVPVAVARSNCPSWGRRWRVGRSSRRLGGRAYLERRMHH